MERVSVCSQPLKNDVPAIVFFSSFPSSHILKSEERTHYNEKIINEQLNDPSFTLCLMNSTFNLSHQIHFLMF